MFWTGVNKSWCLESVAVRWANLLQIASRRGYRLCNPSSWSWRVCDGAHRPVMAAMATRWARDRARDWAEVNPECQTGQFVSKWVRPSLFQNSTSEATPTPSARILLSTQVVFIAFRTISCTWSSHLRSSWTWIPRILCDFFTSNIPEPPTENSGGKSYFFYRENCITKHFPSFMTNLSDWVNL